MPGPVPFISPDKQTLQPFKREDNCTRAGGEILLSLLAAPPPPLFFNDYDLLIPRSV